MRRASDIECSSSSEQSADTVIRVVKKNDKSARKHCNGKEAPHKLGEHMEKFEKHLSSLYCTSYEALLLNREKSNGEVRKRPQGKEEVGMHEETSSGEGSKRLQTLPDVLRSDSLEQWVDGPIKSGVGGQGESDEVLNALPRELREHRGVQGLSSPRVKKLYSALRHKHHKKHTDLDLKGTAYPPNECNSDKPDQVITASPDISAFHTFYTKYKQDLLQKNCNFSAATMHLAEIFMPEKCCCKCHLESDKKDEPCGGSHDSNKLASPHKDKRPHKAKKAEKVKDDPSEVKGVRTADWVTSVQESNFSKFSQLLHSRKQLIRSLQASNCTNELKPLLVQYFQNASPIATFDTPAHNHHPSPPPEYYSCVEHSRKHSNVQKSNSPSNHFDPHVLNNGKLPYSVTTPDVLHEATNARKDGPDGASCHNLFLELQQISNCIDQLSFHDSLQRPARKKGTPRKPLNDGMKSGRNYSSTETIYVPCKEESRHDSEGGKSSRHQSPIRNSPRKNHCSIAMALLSCAARYRGKQSDDDENHAQKNKKNTKLASHFCTKQPLPQAPEETPADDKHRCHGNRRTSKTPKSHRTLVSHSLDRGNIYVTSLNPNSPARTTKHIHL